MACAQCIGIERQFDDSVARRELRRYKRRGPSGSTRLLLEGLASLNISAPSFLDVGGGVGAIQHELMAAGASGGTHADASPSYLRVSEEEATARGYRERIEYVEGDFVDLHEGIPEADVVTLDRVLCCYHDMPALIDAVASRSTRALGIVYPRQTILSRAGVRLINLIQTLRRHSFRVFLHNTVDIEARLASLGLEKKSDSSTAIWLVSVFARGEGGDQNRTRDKGGASA